MSGKRHVIVTGGSRGLGLGIVEALLAEGYRVSTCSRAPSAALERLAGADLFWKPCRIGDGEEVRAFMDAALDWGGASPLWGLVNNAGIAREGVLATFPEIDVEEVIQVNLTGAIQVARAFLRAKLVTRGPGRIVNISSIIGQRGYNGLSAYSASKAGLDGLTRALAREVGRLQVTVNSVAPGYLATEMSGTLAQRQRDQIVRRTPLGRLGEVADVVPVVRFLLGDGAGFMTGQTIVVDGGITG
ncbi:SDR family oxidoreductase [Azospirillum brasilense]|uniref:SDR family oxidoreductase n=1 Tax=Azospirillum brasilense TaxID=192 RepID=A0A0P0EHL2_AZOBR|nr:MULTISPECIES: SDR family oxidoreductase [Azospirillum]ALJ37415.1 short-chain dehydrogenase [Azospirillum brasilense]MDW7552160.1 SDR family oxidoreductase [Azospirillum brasilense]MDW7591595.1 SDR family oxidoreductase [Azospirillum brasilense]MDW7626765.1 SDR family oxidoreductase [Azospirillum brasilense]MDX5950886.1 SDR family oxidoreductase [Azospirillum brasilense]